MNTIHRTRSALLALAAFALCAAPTLAAPPRAPLSQHVDASHKVWVFYVVIAVLGAATLGVSIMSSKRGHQD